MIKLNSLPLSYFKTFGFTTKIKAISSLSNNGWDDDYFDGDENKIYWH